MVGYWIAGVMLAATPVAVPGTVQPAQLGPTTVRPRSVDGPRALFEVVDPRHGAQLWQSDGTPEATHLVAEGLVDPSVVQAFGWWGDGGVAVGSQLGERVLTFVDPSTHVIRRVPTQYPIARLHPFEQSLLAGGSDGLWRVDPLDGGAVRLGAPAYIDAPRRLGGITVLPEPLDLNNTVWTTDGTAGGTTKLPWLLDQTELPVFTERHLYLWSTAFDGGGGLWRSSPPFQTAELVMTPSEGTSLGVGGRTLWAWRSANPMNVSTPGTVVSFDDGVDGGTTRLTVLLRPFGPRAVDNRLFFLSDLRQLRSVPGGSLQLFGSDYDALKTSRGTRLFADLRGRGLVAIQPDGMTAVDVTPHFDRIVETSGRYLVTWDGGLWGTFGETPGMLGLKDFVKEGAVARVPASAVVGEVMTWLQPLDGGGFGWQATRGDGQATWPLNLLPELQPDSGVVFAPVGTELGLVITNTDGYVALRTDGIGLGTRRLPNDAGAVLRGTPLPAEGSVYFSFSGGELRRIDLRSGQVTQAEIPATSPVVLGGSVYFVAPNDVLARFDERGTVGVGTVPGLRRIARVHDGLCLDTDTDAYAYRGGVLVNVGSSTFAAPPTALADGGQSLRIGGCRLDGGVTSFEPGGEGVFTTVSWGAVTAMEWTYQQRPGSVVVLIDHVRGAVTVRPDLHDIARITASRDGGLFWSENSGGPTGTEPVKADVAHPGVELLADVRPGPMPSYATSFTFTPERDFFWAYGDEGFQLFVLPHPAADAGEIDAGISGDAGVVDAGADPMVDAGTGSPMPMPKGCGCTSAPASFVLLALVSLVRRRARR